MSAATFQEKVSSALENLKNNPDNFLTFEIMDYYVDLLHFENLFFVEACSEKNQPKAVKEANKKLEQLGFMLDPDDSQNYVKTVDLVAIEELKLEIEEIFSKIYDRDITSMDLYIEEGKLED